MKVSMREDAINPATNRTKLCNAAFLKGITVRYYQHGVVLTHNNHYISNEDCCSPWWRLCWGSTCCCSEGRPPRPKCAECNLRWPVLIFVFPLNHIYSLIHLLQGTPSVFCAPHTEISTALLLSSGSMLPLLHELGNFHFNTSWVTFYLGASFWFAFGLKLHCQTVEFHAKLPKIKSLRWWVWVGKKHP